MRVPRSVMAVCGVVVAAAAIGFMDPKAVHAVTAALVQVTNTAANPAVTQGVGQQAGNMVALSCPVVSSDYQGTGICYPNSTDLATRNPTPYTVPSGQSLVITAVDLTPGYIDPCPGYYETSLTSVIQQSVPNSIPNTPYFDVRTGNSPVVTHVTYPSGLVIAGGQLSIFLQSTASGAPGSCTLFEAVRLYGYVTPD